MPDAARRFAITIGALLLSACAQKPAYLAEPADVQADGPYRHAPSGMVFPTEVAGFNRTRIAHFAPDGSDAAVAYDLVTTRGDVAATVYLRRAPELRTVGLQPDAVLGMQARQCRADLAHRVEEIERSHIGATPARTRAISIVQDGISRPGTLVTSSYQATLGGRPATVRTELALFCRAGPGWTLEFRTSYPETLAAGDRIAGFMGALDWGALD